MEEKCSEEPEKNNFFRNVGPENCEALLGQTA